MKVSFCALLIIGYLGSCTILKQKEVVSNAEYTSLEINYQIDSLLHLYNENGELNGNVLVIKGEDVIHHNSYGYADPKKSENLKTNCKFGIGSIFKEFPAVSIMKLIENGDIQLNDKISTFLPELPSWSKDISIQNLLQYTSGLPSIDWNKYFGNNIVVTDDIIMQDLISLQNLEFEPGADYRYTNNSPYLLIKIIERVSKMSFESFVPQELFEPLSMVGIEIKSQYPFLDKNLMAIPFNASFEEDQYQVNSQTLLFTATTSDLAKWFIAINTYQVISKESILFLSKTADLTIDNMQAPLGNCTVENASIIEHSHHGSMGNYECLVTRLNPEAVTIVIMTNQRNKNVFEIKNSILSLLQ